MRPVPVLLIAALLAALPMAASAQALRAGIAPDDSATGSVAPVVGPILPPPEEDPYEPLGIRAGGLVLFPALTTTLGYTTNADASAGGSPSAFSILTPELLIRSDWARHEARLKLTGAYEKYFDGSTGTLSGSAEAGARIDFADGWTGDLASSYAFEPQSTSDADYPAGADSPPGVHTLTASAALNGRAGGRGVFSLEGDLDRSLYDNAVVAGIPVDQSDRNNTAFTARLRAGYEATPSLTPFVEGEVSHRLYDRTVDNDGLRRSGVGYAWRAGVAFDHGPFATGEVALGYATETFDDPALAALGALTFDGSLVWAPTELTTVTFNGATSLGASSDPASSGSVVYDGSVDLAYAWRRNVTVTGTAGFRQERHQGIGLTDTSYRAGFGATWRVNRSHHLTAGYQHEWQESTDPARVYQSDAVRLELRMQR